jgi:hypothetical protein
LAATDDERRDTFSAALQQAEDLYDAAAAVGAYARPLPLFYAISQAGRAIAAARSSVWPVGGHGLVEDRGTSEWQGGDVLRFQVRATEKRGVFGAVADALGVRGLTRAVELGALWAALPGLNGPDGGEWPLALGVWPETYSQTSFNLHLGAEHRAYVHLRDQAPSNDVATITALLESYPAASGANVEVAQTIIQTKPTPWGFGVPVRWPAPSIQLPPQGPPPPAYVASFVHVRVPQYRYRREHWLVPFVGEAGDELPPLLLWWVLLFGLSLLARYEPAAWRQALDPDASTLAVPLEELLEEAMAATPALLYEALTGEPGLLPPRV